MRKSSRSRKSTPPAASWARNSKSIVEDGASDWPTFAEKARKLLERDQVAAIFGCYTSASRKAVLPVMERYKGLLYYPTYYEGLERSHNIMYTAQEGTQSAIASLDWLYKNKGKSFYLIGSDYIWPRTMNKIANLHLKKIGAKSRRRRATTRWARSSSLPRSTRSGLPSPTSSGARWWAAPTSPSTSN